MKSAADIARIVRDPETPFQTAVEAIQLFADRQAHEAAVRSIRQTGESTMRMLDAIFPLQPAGRL